MDRVQLAWAVGGRVPRRLGDALARVAAPLINLRRIPAVEAWADSVERATSVRPTRRQKRQLLESWIRNNLWSLSLAGWSARQVRAVAVISDDDRAKLGESLAGPGLVIALPHMGSWDFAGTWAATVGIKVVSVAERMPRGVYEQFVRARSGMGMSIYPVDQRDLMPRLVDDVEAGRLVCLLADRDLSSRGIHVSWPGGDGKVGVPVGPAILARRTGADLRVATTWYAGDRMHIEVSDRIVGDSVEELMAGVVAVFADAVRRHPESWLMLRRVFV